MDSVTIAFLGAGNLTRSVVSGLIADDYDPKKIWVANPSAEKLMFFKDRLGVQVTTDNLEAVAQSDVVILATKPTQMKTVCDQIKDSLATKNPLLISVAVGVTDEVLGKWLKQLPAVILAMPNTPATVGAGATGLFAGHRVTQAQKDTAETIFRAVGITLWVKTVQQLDWVCALSGCGPGYLFLVMESMESVAIQQGLPVKDARLLTAQTLLGASRMALESDCSLAELREQVTSPQGATAEAIRVLQKGNIAALFSQAIESAAHRAQELRRLLSEMED